MNEPQVHLFGAEGAEELIGFLSGDQSTTEIRRSPGSGQPATVLSLSRAQPEDVHTRHVLAYSPEHLVPIRPRTAFVPPRTLVIADSRVDLGSVASTADCLVLSVGESSWELSGQPLGEAEQGVRAAIRDHDPRHVRVIVDLGQEQDWLDRTPATVLRVHDAALLAAQAAAPRLAEGGSFHVVALRGADQKGITHPCAGLFSGFVKTLEVEPEVIGGIDCFALFTSADTVAEAAHEVQAESSARRALPTVIYAAGRRMVPRVVAERTSPSSHDVDLIGTSVVIGAGAGRGIGMVMLRALAERCRPHIHVIGSNRIGDYEPEALTEDTVAFKRRRAELLRQAATGPNRRPVQDVVAELRRIEHAREVVANLRALEELCGIGKVSYHACDLTDGAMVETTAAEILAGTGGQVDLLLNVAGTFKSALLTKKSLADFRATRDVKVDTYRHLKRAFGTVPARWVNASSVLGLYGMRGETDYTSANDFLFTAAAHANAVEDFRETSMGWGLWGEAGHALDPGVAEVMRQNADVEPMSSAEGVRHFLGELARPVVTACPMFLGPVERAAAERHRPAISALWKPEEDFYVDEVVERSVSRIVMQRSFSLERDGYLEDHLIKGRPTMPGLVLVEFAAQVSERLTGRVPTAVVDLAFTSFVHVTAQRPVRLTFTAEFDAEQDSVTVVITSDVVAPNGTVLVRDRENARMSVRFDQHDQTPPPETPFVGGDAVDVENIYASARPYAELRGVFGSVSTISVGGGGNRSESTMDSEVLGRWFERAFLPFVLCDSAIQAAFCQNSEDRRPVLVPRLIDRIDFFGEVNDHRIASGARPATITSTRLSRVDHNTYRVASLVAADPQGQVFLRATGVTTAVIGRLEPSPVSEPDEPAVRPHLIAYDPEHFVRPVTRLAAFPVAAPLTPVPVSHLRGWTVLLLGAERTFVAAVAAKLRDAGVLVRTATTAGELREIAVDWDGVIDLNLTGLPDYTLGDRTWEDRLALTTEALHLVYRVWGADARQNRHFYLAVTHQDGLFGRAEDAGPICQPVAGAWQNLAKMLPIELPTVAGKVIDLDNVGPAAVADAVLAEAGVWDHFEIGYHRGRRHRIEHRIDPPPPPNVPTEPIGPGDCVLISGGGRGVGLAVARALAARGADVVVTGREVLPSDREPRWLTMTEQEFAAWRTERLRRAGSSGGRLAVAKSHVDRAARTRQLRENLLSAERDGLRLTYRVCDVADLGEVRELVAGLPRRPTVLVHNASVYRGVRLSSIAVTEMVRTVGVKVEGFANLLAALTRDGDGPRMVCNLGSIGERFGGTIGQTAYCAANNALAQMGFWAAKRYGIPVRTLAWPTWERLGNIVNYRGAARYGSMMDPVEGVAHCLREMDGLVAPGGSEYGYFGRLGVMFKPGWLSMTSWPPGHPDARRVETAVRQAGTVRKYVENRLFATRHVLRDATPADLLECVLAAGDWVRPEGEPLQHLVEISDLNCIPAAEDVLEVDLDATGSWADDGTVWQVDVVVTSMSGAPVLSCRLRYGEQPPELSPTIAGGTTRAVAKQRRSADGRCLSHSALASMFAVLLREQADGSVYIGRLMVRPGCARVDSMSWSPEEPDVFEFSADGEVLMSATGVTVSLPGDVDRRSWTCAQFR
ncbi:SDR family NAD(P)-dependent oxidoreductase [Lentzea sp. NPDC034063]|uniref:SDR family NAD(P)-dependent oxidoreductase n=1 Tax=unclassified Lentzea TaxID=2643253 RepID=UPI0033E5A71E